MSFSKFKAKLGAQAVIAAKKGLPGAPLLASRGAADVVLPVAVDDAELRLLGALAMSERLIADVDLSTLETGMSSLSDSKLRWLIIFCDYCYWTKHTCRIADHVFDKLVIEYKRRRPDDNGFIDGIGLWATR